MGGGGVLLGIITRKIKTLFRTSLGFLGFWGFWVLSGLELQLATGCEGGVPGGATQKTPGAHKCLSGAIAGTGFLGCRRVVESCSWSESCGRYLYSYTCAFF